MTKIFQWHFFLPQFCFRLRSQQIILWWYLVQCLYVMTIFFSSLSVCYQRWMLYSEICGCRRGRSSGSCSRHQFKVHHSVSWLWYYTIYITIKRLIFMVHACKFEKKRSFCGITYTSGINKKLLLYYIMSFMVQMRYMYGNGHCTKSIVTYPQQMLTFYRFMDNFFPIRYLMSTNKP